MKSPRQAPEAKAEEPRVAYARVGGADPAGKVATYGQIARLAGFPGYARQVGYALHGLPEGRGALAPRDRCLGGGSVSVARAWTGPLQRASLEAEGVEVDDWSGRISLSRFQWCPSTKIPGDGVGSRYG